MSCLIKASRSHTSRTGFGGGFLRHTAGVRLIGYTRVSTTNQDAQLQLDALVEAGVQKRDVFADVTSGSKAAAERPVRRQRVVPPGLSPAMSMGPG